MSAGRIARVNEDFAIFLQLDNGIADQYPRVVIIDSNGAVEAIVDLYPVSGVAGKYLGAYKFTEAGDYNFKFTIYSDSGRTQVNKAFKHADETIRVTNLEENVESVLEISEGSPIAEFD
jgi:hypothetical protein